MKIFTLILIFTSMLFYSGDYEKISYLEEPPISEQDIVIEDVIIGSNKVRGMQLVANMAVNTAEELLVYVDRAKAKGANTIFFADSKTNTFGINGTAGNRWDTEMKKFSDGVKERDMDLIFMTVVMGFCGSLIADEPNLTTGYPIKNQPLLAVNGELVPINTSNVPNGGFESYTGNLANNWTFQDAPGARTFIDTSIKHSGNASFRAEAKGGAMSRIITAFNVKPFHQYTLRFWVKTQNLTAGNLLAIIRDDNNKDRNLTNLELSTARNDGGRSYFKRPNKLTMDWTEVRIAFNSLNATKVNLGLSMFGGTEGKIWWDDVEILDTPVLNWLNRDDLPKSVQLENGGTLNFGADVTLPVDTKLGLSGYEGRFDTHHDAPKIRIANGTKIKEGDIITINGYHGLPTANGQISCSWNSPESYARMRRVHQTLQDTYAPAGFLLNYSEIRTGGWEPTDTQYATSGEALAASIKVVFDDLFEIAPTGKFYFWNDMVDPNHNAKANYYQINNTIDESWLTLDPNKVIIATWWERQKITDLGPSSLNFFSNLGFEQITGAFYDEDVTANYDRWQTAAENVDGIVGNMYATWVKDYSKIEAYGDLWWVPGEQEEEPVDTILSIAGPDEVSPNGTYTVEVDYTASEVRDIIVILQLNKAPWTNYGSARTPVTEGSNSISVDFSVNEDIPFATNAYKWTAFITPAGKDWADRLHAIIQANVDSKQEKELVDELVSLTAPQQVIPGNTYTVTADYTASEAREIAAYLQLNKAPWTVYAYEAIVVPREENTVAFELTIATETPIANADYKWATFITPIGKQWDDRLDIIQQKDIDVISPISIVNTSATSDLKMYPNPTSTTIAIESEQDILYLNIYNMEGRLQKQIKTLSDKNINVSDLPDGIYILDMVMTNGEKISKQLIVKH